MIGLYMALCFLLAIAGRGTRIGASGVFLLAVMFTPIAVGMVFAMLRQMSPKETPKNADQS
ncbi:MAG: hypothetical protein HN377_11310 [Alphaproteobacteria bacterium]|nr:hypothetical protein [Alphaproteobacteria bacterium]